MDFRTKVDIKSNGLHLSHRNRILMLGSCFTDNIGERMMDAGFDCVVNPFGALYNPLSILNALEDRSPAFLEWVQKPYPKEEFDANISRVDTYILTFGTAWVYVLNQTGLVVSNCKKQPDYLFTRRRLSIDEIVDVFSHFIDTSVIPPRKRIVFTVSPIRHKKDGLHENQLSKSILLLSIDALCKAYPDNCFYFPAFEIMMDELRDYRFYADDMLHPSQIAVNYIWEQFQKAFFEKKTIDFIEQFESLNRTLKHRPTDATNEKYVHLVAQTQEQINQLKHAIQNQ